MRRANWSGVALLAAVAALVIAAAALTRVERGGSTFAASGPVRVTLGEFFIRPAVVEGVAGQTVLRVANGGGNAHDLAVVGTSKHSPLIQPGQAVDLDVSDLPAGTYELICAIPGHDVAGMRGTLVLSAGAGGAPAAAEPAQSGQGTHIDADHMDEVMAARTHAFPAANQGVGAVVLEPTVLPDGVKQFSLTASVVDWEVEPGKVVEAWTYNGTVPGPTLKANSGDTVRVVLTNELPESTAVHFHGLRTPNSMDGVPDITQDPVKPGSSFVYEFEAKGPAVGMYHSHHNAAKQVPYGLAGAFIVDQIPLPDDITVEQEIPMMLNDAGPIGYSLNGKSFPATAPIVAEHGEWILVHYLNEGLQLHPMHLHGPFQLVVARDGVPLKEPYWVDTVTVSPGERWSVLVAADEPGVWAWHCHVLTHAESEDIGMFGMVTALIVAEP